MDAVLAAGGAFAEGVDKDATADLGPVLHVDVHPKTSRLRDLDGVSETPIVVPEAVSEARGEF